MVDSSINLARTDDAGWNFNALLGRMAAGAPDLELRNVRINFRTGTMKSAFYLNEVNLDLTPGPDGYEWSYEASPARTDRAEAGFGRFTGQGRWRPGAGANEVDIEMELERSATSEVMILVTGRDLGVPGRVAARARLAGQGQDIRVTGSFQFEGLERSGIFGWRGPALRLPFGGTLNMPAQSLRLATPETGKEVPPVGVTVGVTNLLTSPRWSTSFRLERLPAASVLELARRLGTNVPDELSVTGALEGSLHLSQDEPPAGKVELTGAQVRMGDGGGLTVERAAIDWSGTSMLLAPSRVRSESGSEAEVSGAWSVAGEALEFRVSSERLPVDELQAAIQRTPRTSPPPLFDHLEQGVVSGALEYRRDAAGVSSWRGDFALTGAAVKAEGVPDPLQVERAQVSLRGDDLALRKLRLIQAGATWDGEASWRSGAVRPLRFRLSADEIGAQALESWLLPSVAPRGTFLERTLRFRRAPLPPWLRARRAEGEIAIAALRFGDQTLGKVQARLYWDGARVDLPSLEAEWNESRFSGRLAMNLAAPGPTYRLMGRVDNIVWKNARGEAEIEVKAAGVGAALLSTLRLDGNFSARNVPLGEETARSVSGCLELSFDRAEPRARLRCFEMTLDGEVLTGQGATQEDGRLIIDASGARRAVRVVGALQPLALEIEAAR
jgi:hypothetical protein